MVAGNPRRDWLVLATLADSFFGSVGRELQPACHLEYHVAAYRFRSAVSCLAFHNRYALCYDGNWGNCWSPCCSIASKTLQRWVCCACNKLVDGFVVDRNGTSSEWSCFRMLSFSLCICEYHL